MIWGKGAEGSAALSYLQKHKVCKNISIYNDDDGSEVLENILSHTDVIIRSPGGSIYKKELQQALAKGIKITSCSDLFLSEMRTNHKKTKVIGISGSKGKSTSSSMLYHMLKKMGKKVSLGGNIGKPLIEIIDDDINNNTVYITIHIKT